MRSVILMALVGVASVTGVAIAAPRFQSGFLSYEVDVFSYSAATADLDGGGHPDIVVSYPNAKKLGVLRGSAGGTFTAAESLSTQNNFVVAISDLNGDGHPDIVCTGCKLTSAFLGNGDLTFQPRVDYNALDCTNNGGLGLAIADIRGDGRSDVSASDSAHTVSVRPGLGNGTLGAPVARLAAPYFISQLVAADLNGDGKVDVAWSQDAGSNLSSISVYLNHGGGVFDAETSYPADSSRGLVIGDVDNDGKLDLMSGAQWFRGNGAAASMLPSSC